MENKWDIDAIGTTINSIWVEILKGIEDNNLYQLDVKKARQ